MSSEYSRGILRVVVAQICQTIGWHSINSTPLEFMVDLMQEYLLRVSKLTHQYAEVLGRIEPNLDDLGLAFRHMNIDVQELVEYVKNVDMAPCPIAVPKFPIPRENHLNFLKPGSREVVTRPVHVHEHLPAMYPDTEEEYVPEKTENLTNGIPDNGSSNGTPGNSSVNVSPHKISPQVVFKRPGDPVSFESPMVKRVKVVEEGRPLREIHSVMMTTSGFLSPAREGKLPEARTPHQTRSDSPQPSSYPMVPPELKNDKKPKKIVKKAPEYRKLDKENKKKNRVKDLFKPDKIDDSKVKKLAGMKELAKLKALKPGGGKVQANTAGPSSRPPTPKLIPPKASSPKISKAAQSKIKIDKTIDLPDGPPSRLDKKEEDIAKLPSEPDKQKLNIFKKISKPREDKDKDIPDQHKVKELDSRESSPGLVIDENNEKHFHKNEGDIKREDKRTPHTPDVHVHAQPDGEMVELHSPSSDVYMFDDMSPPGTPSTPKTPELNVPLPEKKRKKEKANKKREPKLKSPKHCVSPKKTKVTNDTSEMDIPDRPKTPQALETPLHKEPALPPSLPFPLFPPFPPAPGLIPYPMFQGYPLPLGKGPGPHPVIPNLPLPPRFLNPPKTEDFSLKPKLQDKPVTSLTMDPPTTKLDKPDKEKVDKMGKVLKQDKEILIQTPGNSIAPPIVTAPVAHTINHAPPSVLSLLPSKISKIEKLEKNDKKSKEHKKEKKDKLKKKKDKKEKHKEKGEKLKEKKEKTEKREKLEKVKDKKEKKEKKKEKDVNKKNMKENKNIESVPKITLKLGPNSPRPPTPDSAPMKKITIKPLLKKPEDEAKREPSPELAKISALVTRPPKQKATSKKTEEGTLDGSPALSTDTSFSTNLTSVPLPVSRTKKSLFKGLLYRESSPPQYENPIKISNSLPVQQQAPYYFKSARNITNGFNNAEMKADGAPKKDDAKEDKENGKIIGASVPTTTVDQEGNQVWICPGCGNQDDGSPMVGCDACDAWYHWVCVGMQVPPATTENWYCRFCIAKKQEQQHHDKKKKKRKKKVKVNA